MTRALHWDDSGCGAGGSHEAFPFLSGMIQVLSHSVANAIANSSDVAAFTERASRSIDLATWDRTEDVALGFWIVQLLISGSLTPQVAFAALEKKRGHNLGCRKYVRRPTSYSTPISMTLPMHDGPVTHNARR